MKKTIKTLIALSLLSACSTTSKGEGQVIYHWERENTGIEKFSRDHSECMKKAEDFRLLPNVKSWFYSEEARLDIRANWHTDKGVWASYVAYPGAQPVIVNSLRRNESISPRKYRMCMEDKGYWHRTSNIPTTSNIYTYHPQRKTKDLPFEYHDF
ncbi:MAG: hypothetical protein PHE89_05085 [Alphaproteobacteria bacterium]|nr:hypothetical protein [Alphaproteobacteria bacterium]